MLSFRAPSQDCARVSQPATPYARELYRENCQDEDGKPYCVIVWQAKPGARATAYTLVDGSPVTFVSDCEFEIMDTGKIISRCE
jgi:hypothetical protein